MFASSTGSITINVRMSAAGSEARRFTLPSALNPQGTSISQLKSIIAAMDESDRCPMERQRLIYKGKIMNVESRMLSDYGLVDNDQTVRTPAS